MIMMIGNKIMMMMLIMIIETPTLEKVKSNWCMELIPREMPSVFDNWVPIGDLTSLGEVKSNS